METEGTQPPDKSAILKGKYMAAGAIATIEPVNPLELATQMGVDMEVLARAVGVDSEVFKKQSGNTGRDEELRLMAELWNNLVVLVGDERRARSFLRCSRPELNNEKPIYYFEHGEPGVVLDLIVAMRELLP